jgi:hypothetical protein
MGKWSRVFKEADDWLADLNFGSARKRVCNLVLKMRSVVDAQTVTLFAREDMGAMLDLKMETVNSEVSALVRVEALGPLNKYGRVYRILNLDCLLAARKQALWRSAGRQWPWPLSAVTVWPSQAPISMILISESGFVLVLR